MFLQHTGHEKSNAKSCRREKTILPTFSRPNRWTTLVEAACMFWKTFDVACTFYKILENVSKSLDALQYDCSMKVFRKVFDALCKKLCIFYATYRTLLVFAINFCNNLFFKKMN